MNVASDAMLMPWRNRTFGGMPGSNAARSSLLICRNRAPTTVIHHQSFTQIRNSSASIVDAQKSGPRCSSSGGTKSPKGRSTRTPCAVAHAGNASTNCPNLSSMSTETRHATRFEICADRQSTRVPLIVAVGSALRNHFRLPAGPLWPGGSIFFDCEFRTFRSALHAISMDRSR